MKTQKTPFTEWEPAISAEEVFSDVIGLAEIKVEGKKTNWLEMRPEKKADMLLFREMKLGRLGILPNPSSMLGRESMNMVGEHTLFSIMLSISLILRISVFISS